MSSNPPQLPPDPAAWFPFGHASVADKPKLFCLPFAGGSASFFLSWRRALGDVTVVPIQYPGRETRIQEALPRSLHQLAEDVAQALLPQLDGPYFLLGYSLGAKLAYAVCQRLLALGAPGPELLVVAAHGAPDSAPVIGGAADLPEDEFRALLRQYGGVPDIVFEDPELGRLLLPILRNDMRLAAQPLEGLPLACPVVAYAGTADAAALPDAVAQWQRHTRGSFQLRSLEGGHFFARSNPEFLTHLARDLHAGLRRADSAPCETSWEIRLPHAGHVSSCS